MKFEGYKLDDRWQARFISDCHFFSESVIKLDNRPFSSVEEMNRYMIHTWNSNVPDNCIVFILGDFCDSEDEEDWIDLLTSLRGRKWLIRGNHDPSKLSYALQSEFFGISDYLEVETEGKNVILSHYPIPFYSRAYNKDTFMFYGHVHQTREYEMMKRLKKHLRDTCKDPKHNKGNLYNVGAMLPLIQYRPRSFSYIVKSADKYEFDGGTNG